MDGNQNYRTLITPNLEEIHELISNQHNNTLHIFSGIRWVPTIVAALNAVKTLNAHFAIMSEPRVREGWKGSLRYIHSLLTENWLRQHTAFVLGIGRNGPSWFTSIGYNNDSVFPFAYFVDLPKQPNFPLKLTPTYSHVIQIGYVGRLIKMKGVFDVISAANALKSKAQLNIVGTGVEEFELKKISTTLKLNTNFLGVLPIHEVGSFMTKMDVLVLASTSTDDGWGVVVSEALMSGTAVIATPCVGASIILDEPLFGRCVPINSPEKIADAVRQLQASGAFSEDARARRQKLATSILSAESGARTLLKIINWKFGDGPRPEPFYQTENNNQ